MTTPTDEQIDQFAMVISDANCPGYAPCSDIHDPGVTLHYRALARVAWDHVARQIMPIQVGDTVVINEGMIGTGLTGVVMSANYTAKEAGHHVRVEGRYERWFSPDQITLVPAGESGEEATDE